MIPVLEINELTLSFSQGKNETKAVDQLSIRINRGETLGIVGESGSGKSVTSLAIMQLLSKKAHIHSGEIVLHLKDNEKKDLLHLSDKEIRKLRGNHISMIFQEPMTSLNPVMKCGKQVDEVLLLHQKLSKKEAKAKTLALFSEVKLEDAAAIYEAYPHQLSGGQKQRIMIAMAMACKPALLIADEPTTALDVNVQYAVTELIRQLKEKYDTTTLFISHDLNLVSNIADYIAVVYKGKIVEYAKTSALFSNPKHAYTKGLMACRPPMDKRLKQLPLVDDFLYHQNHAELLMKKENEITDEMRKQNHEEIYRKKPILKIEHLAVSFAVKKSLFGKVIKSTKAVDGINFEIYQGETLGLIGESGCGKTTLSRSLMGLIKADSGKIIFKDLPVSASDTKAIKSFRKKVQIVFQDPYGSLNPRLSIGEAIMEPMHAHRLYSKTQCREKTIELLNKVGLDENSFNRYPHEFSGGQRQRISIARALALSPEVLICDESVSSLDVSVQAQIINLLNSLKKEFGLTYLFISHDLAVVRYMSDRIMVMEKGRIIEIQEADMLFSRPQQAYTKRLIASIPNFK